MHLFCQIILIISMAKSVLAIDLGVETYLNMELSKRVAGEQDLEVAKWQEALSELNNISGKKEDIAAVLADLDRWGPEQSCSLWKPFMYIRDRYLNDDISRSTIRSFGWPAFATRFYELIIGPISAPLDMLSHTTEIGYLIVHNTLHKLPYIYRKNIDEVFFDADLDQSVLALLSHASFLAAGLQIFDPLNAYSASALFALLSIYLSSFSEDYIDVALRSLERSYFKSKDQALLLVAQEMIYWRKNKAHQKIE